MKVIQNIDEYNAYFRQPALHPLVAVGNLAYADLSLFEPTDFDMYCIVLMDSDFGTLVRNGISIGYTAGTIFSLRPGQEVHMDLHPDVPPRGWMLAFRKELLEKCGLGRDFYMFEYFFHDMPDALTLTTDEREAILRSFSNLLTELHAPTDNLRNHMLRLHIGVLLSYCKRFFERQFSEHLKDSNDFAEQLHSLISNYITSGQAAKLGQPTVAWCAAQFSLSPNYFGDLVKQQMHITAKELIKQKVIQTAQRLLTTTTMNVSEIAQELGFNYPNHFTRMFCNHTGKSPTQYRSATSPSTKRWLV